RCGPAAASGLRSRGPRWTDPARGTRSRGLVRGIVPQALALGVGLDQRDLLLAAAGHAQVVGGDLVDREDRDGGTELRAHIADGRAVGQRHLADAFAVELDELA